jgi:hypothetical protein
MIELSDDAVIRLFAAEPRLAPAVAEAAAALDKLLQQFIREGRCRTAVTASVGGGRWLAVAWEGPPLSGCSHDKLAQVIAAHEQRSGAVFLSPPPIAVGPVGAIRLTHRSELRQWLAAGICTADTPVWNWQVTNLGDWRRQPQGLAASFLAPLLASPVATISRGAR